jgi:hypothetical protein
VTIPRLPSVNTNASASGTPAKLLATPEKVMSALRMNRGTPPRMTAAASRNPKIAPIRALMNDR